VLSTENVERKKARFLGFVKKMQELLVVMPNFFAIWQRR